MCQRVITAVRGEEEAKPDAIESLLKAYEGRITFEVRSANTDEGKQASEKYAFGDLRHGLVALDKDGSPLFTLPGHNYGRDKIVEKLEGVLK